MLGRLLASIGIGSAKIDTILEKTRFEPGEQIRGTVNIQGGSTEQRIDAIQLSVMTEYIRESNDQKHKQHAELGRFHISNPFTVEAGEQRSVPFSFQLPYRTPLTIGRAPVWVKTELDIRGAIDPNDNDRIEVVPTHAIHTILEALNVLGFSFRKAECEYASRLGGGQPFVQEFEFIPTSHFRGQLDELEVMFYPSANKLDIILQIDRKARGLGSLFAEALDWDESFVRCSFTREQLSAGPNAVAQSLAAIISRYA